MGLNSPAQMVCIACNGGKAKGNLSVIQLFLRGIMAGIYIAVGAGFCTIVKTGTATFLGAGINNLLGAAVFPIGLIAIVLTGMELFTGNAMLLPMAVWSGKSTWGKLLNNWTWVYLGNLVGSLAFAALMVIAPFTQGALTAAEPNAFGLTAAGITVAKILPYKAAGSMGMLSVFASGIGCNFIVCLAILLAMTAQDVIGKMAAIWFPIMTFVAIGFEHSVANMYFLPAGKWIIDLYPSLLTKVDAKGVAAYKGLAANGPITWGDIWVWNIIPVTLGNIVGAMIVIGATYYFCFKNEAAAIDAAAAQPTGAAVSK